MAAYQLMAFLPLLTPDLEVTDFLALSFHKSVGDHRTMIVEITESSAIGRFQGNIVCPTSRRLTLRQPWSVQAYNDEMDKQLKRHNIAQRIALLRDEVTHLGSHPPPNLELRCMCLHSQTAQIRIHSKKSARNY